MSLSSITLSGTLKKDPEKRFTPTNIPVTNLMVEVCFIPRGSQTQNEPISSQVVRVNAWRDLAEQCESKLKAGDRILITGRVQINAYTTNDGKKKREIEIDATSIVPLASVLEVKAPPKKEEEKISQSESVERMSNLDEVVTHVSTEEIPF